MATIDLACEMSPEAVWQNLRRDWLVCLSSEAQGLESTSERWFEQVTTYCSQLETDSQKISAQGRPQVLIAERDPSLFLAKFWAALLADWDIVLANPDWGASEWQTVGRLIQPTIVWADSFPIESFLVETAPVETDRYSDLDPRLILIPTGGSSGQVKFVCHHWHSLVAAAVGFCDYFALSQPANAYCILPLYHVSGLMQAFRAFVSGGQLFVVSSLSSAQSHADIEQVFERLWPESPTFISLVPTQLERFLRVGKSEWLSQFTGVLLGGAPVWDGLLDRAVAANVPICLSYGMTETAAMVTATQPKDSLVGSGVGTSVGSGRCLAHAEISIERDGQRLLVGEIGQVVVRSPAVAKGYCGYSSAAFDSGTFYTDDLGYLDSSGNLHISGRMSHKIISGGENIFPAEVEAALLNTQQVRDVYVLGWPDAEWGEVVTAVYVPGDRSVSPASLKSALASLSNGVLQLSHYKHPKKWVALAQLPRNAQGKLNRSALMRLVRSHLQ